MVVILAGDSPRGSYPGGECPGVGVRIRVEHRILLNIAFNI